MEMLNLGKWNNQTIESVRHVLEKAKMPCIGFSMVFLEPLDGGHSLFRFKTMLAFDPDNPVPEEEILITPYPKRTALSWKPPLSRWPGTSN
jgi:hypothetical protein